MKTSALSKLGQRTEAPPISWLMQLTLDQPQLISLAAGFTDNESLPVEETRALLNEILGQHRSRRAALQYGTPRGDPHLCRLVGRPGGSWASPESHSAMRAFPRPAAIR